MVLEVSGGSGCGGEEFARAEQECVPLVMRGLVHDWPAIRKWKGSEGRRYMKEVAGGQEIKVMCSQNHAFYGAIERHRPLTCTFDEFVDNENNARWKASGVHTYLAQTPMNEGSLKALSRDLSVPMIMQHKNIAQVNLWMAADSSRSSPHYDPYNNVLCVVTGSKRVKLCSPSLTPTLYPLPVWGDSANHSSVNFVDPDFETHPEYRHALEQGETIMLHAGDALFIPEGWWHQVDSEADTIGVNFWWRSQFYDLMRGHMGSYFLRESLRAIAAKQMDSLINLVNPLSAGELCRDSSLSDSESDVPASESMSSPTPQMSDCSGDDISFDRSSVGTCSDDDSVSGEDPPVDMEPQRMTGQPHANEGMHTVADIPEATSPRLPLVPADEGGHDQHSTDGSAQPKGTPHRCVSLVDLDDDERQGLLWLAGLLCGRATMDDRRGLEFNESSENVTRWLRSFSSISFCRIIYVFARSFPNLMPLFWEMLNPVGAYVVTNHFESLEGPIKELPDPQEFYCRIYGDDEEQVLSHILHGRGVLGKFAMMQALEKEALIME